MFLGAKKSTFYCLRHCIVHIMCPLFIALIKNTFLLVDCILTNSRPIVNCFLLFYSYFLLFQFVFLLFFWFNLLFYYFLGHANEFRENINRNTEKFYNEHYSFHLIISFRFVDYFTILFAVSDFYYSNSICPGVRFLLL